MMEDTRVNLEWAPDGGVKVVPCPEGKWIMGHDPFDPLTAKRLPFTLL
jgi:hypothetical protein